MTWYEALLWLAGICGAAGTIWKLIDRIAKPIRERLNKTDAALAAIEKLQRHDREQYLGILRLTIMSPEMPISERIIAGQKYIAEGGNGDVKVYYEQMLVEHTH